MAVPDSGVVALPLQPKKPRKEKAPKAAAADGEGGEAGEGEGELGHRAVLGVACIHSKG